MPYDNAAVHEMEEMEEGRGREREPWRKVEYERLQGRFEVADRSARDQLNLVFMVQAFLFGAEAVVGQTAQQAGHFADMKVAIAALYFLLPFLGLSLSFLSWSLLKPMFVLQQSAANAIVDVVPGQDDTETLIRAKEARGDSDRYQHIQHIYLAIISIVAFVWLVVMGSSFTDLVREWLY